MPKRETYRPSTAKRPPTKPDSPGKGHRVTPEQRRVFWERRDSGFTIATSCRAANFSLSTGNRLERQERPYRAGKIAELNAPDPPGPRDISQLCDEARRALTTFAYFQLRYFGVIPVPWQAEGAEKMAELLVTEQEEYVVVNAPQGSGKSTTFTLHFACWVTCRNRAIRGQIGSLTAKLANGYVARIRRELERVIPVKAKPNDLRLGLAQDAVATMAMDFGRFEPLERDTWTRDQFIVMQTDGVAITEKEATWSAWGKDTGFLGGRYDLVIWDDLTDPHKVKTAEARDALKEWYSDIAESRLEPGGLMILQGQRTGADDIYRYALDMTSMDYDDDGEEIENTELRKYQHIIFKAHYETRCQGGVTHKPNSPPYPEGCLLYPRRLTWKKLAELMANRETQFQVMMQQEDTDPADLLINPTWIYGDQEYPGCLDRERGLLEVPKGLGQCLSVVSCDPSPTNRWGVLWWLVEPGTNFRYLIDIFNGKMEAPDLLDRDQATQQFTGLMEEWQKKSYELNIPITHWIIEINAAQRFMLQYDHVKKWRDQTRVTILAHTTGVNKSDKTYGVETIAPDFRFGRYRLPWNGSAMPKVKPLVDELTRYGHMRTDDLVMATWFLNWNLPNITHIKRPRAPQFRPSWL